MIDIEIIRKNPEIVKEDLKKRGLKDLVSVVDSIKKKDEEWRKVKSKNDDLRADRNKISKQINEAKKAGKDVKSVIEKAKKIPAQIEKNEKKVDLLREEINLLMEKIPNLLDETVPFGESEEDNTELKKNGKIPEFSFELKNHVELCEELDVADFERSAKISGNGFYFLKNELVLLENALVQFALDTMSKRGFTLTSTPLMIRKKPYQGVVDFGAFEEVIYKIEDEDAYLIATSEHPLTAQFIEEIVDEKSLPITVAGVSSCFRKEAGGHGVDEKGLFRVHQFKKVEQIVLCKPEESQAWHERLLSAAEEIYTKLKLPYRVITLCSADTGLVSSKTYDLEVWMPRTQKYREVVSCSNVKDYQARRLKIRFRTDENKMMNVHTLNSTALATTRTMVAILENYQQKNGSVKIPKVLQPYMNDIKVIEPK